MAAYTSLVLNLLSLQLSSPIFSMFTKDNNSSPKFQFAVDAVHVTGLVYKPKRSLGLKPQVALLMVSQSPCLCERG